MAEKIINKKNVDNLDKAISYADTILLKKRDEDKKINSYLTGNSGDAVAYIEATYPEMAKEYRNICQEQYELFCRKQSNYGPSNIAVGTDLKSYNDVKLSLTGLWFRMNDKIQRLKNLLILGKTNVVDESIEDSFQDVSNYGIIAQLVSRGKWAK